MPALLTRICTGPSAARTRSNSRVTSSATDTSAPMATARPPARSISATTSSAASERVR
nr:hypothetical protein [Nocardia terpenica]